MEKYDVIIVGGACAGMSAAIYSARRALKTLVITKDIGGQIATTTEVENYPGTGTLLGPELAESFHQQAKTAGAQIKFGEVTGLKKNNDQFEINSSLGEFQAPAVILCFGLEHRKLNVPGEKEFVGKGISYCATCDAPFFKNKTVGVVGGGNSALDAAEFLSKLAAKVYLFVRTDQFRAEQVLIDAVKNAPNVEIKYFTQVKEVAGDQFVREVKLITQPDNQASELNLDGLFVEIGWMAKTDFLKDLVKLNERGFIIVNNRSETSCPGLYAAGDVTDTPFKQAVISAGEGAKAALAAAQYLQEMRGGQSAPAAPDWTKKK